MIDLNRKLPIGIQTFEDIRKEGYLYVENLPDRKRSILQSYRNYK